MPNIIDDYVQKMSFDNSNFEKNISVSMKSLDKLRDKLDFKGVKDGLDELVSTVKKITFDTTTKSLETVISKFNTLDVIAYSALNRIVSGATDAGIKLAKSLSIDQITSGWAKYAQETSAVQTIMSSTGESMDTVNTILEKLSWFSDETSYSFNDMVGNIAKFTSNGVKLETAQSAMQGIALAAALAGQNSQSAAHAMYNFAQSLGNGYVQLIDWKSINTANIDTVEFKNTIIETAKAVGTLSKEGKILTSGLKKTNEEFVTTANFAQTLNARWLTSDVLIKSLEKYGNFATQLQTLTDATDTTATEWMSYIRKYQKGSLDFAEAAKNIGMTERAFRENIKQLTSDDLGLRAFMAGQQTKTWSELVDATKDAASSKWSKIFKIIFGDYDEARDFYSTLVERFYNTFVEPLNGLIDIMDSWKSAGGRNSFINTLYTLYDAIEQFNSSIIEKATKNISAFHDTIDGLDQGQRLARITKNVETFISSLYTKKYSNGKTIIEEAGNAIGEAINIVNTTVLYGVKIISKSGKILKTAIKDLFPGDIVSNSYSLFLNELYSIGDRLQTAFKAFELNDSEKKSLTNIAKIVYVVLKNFSEIFADISIKFAMVTTTIRFITDTILEQIEKIMLKIYELNEAKSLFQRALSGFNSALQYLNINPKNINFSEISKILVNTFNIIYDTLRFFPKVIKGLLGPIKNAWESVFPDDMKTESYKLILTNFYKLGENIKKAVNNFSITEKEAESITNIFKGIFTILKLVISAVSTLMEYIPDILSSARSILDIILNVVGKVNSVIFKLEESMHLSEMFGNIFESIKNTLENAKKYFGLEGKNLFQIIFSIINPVYIYVATMSFVVYKLVEKIIKTFSKPKNLKQAAGAFIGSINDIVDKISEVSKTIEKNIKIDSISKLAAAIIALSVSLLIISRINIEQLGVSISTITILLGELMATILLIPTGTTVKVIKITSLLFSLSTSIVLLTAPLLLLGKMSWGEMIRGVLGLAAILGLLILTTKLINKIRNREISTFFKFSIAMISLAIAIDLLSIPVITLGMMDYDKITNGLGALIIMITSLLLTIKMSNMINNKDVSMFLKMSASMFIFANALIALSIPILLIGSMDVNKIIYSLGAVTYLVAMMFGVAILISKIKFNSFKTKGFKQLSNAFIVMAFSVTIFAIAMKTISSIPSDKILISLGVITLILLEFIGIVFILGKIPLKKSLILAKDIGFLFLELSISMAIISNAIRTLGKMNEVDLLQGITASLLILGSLIGTLAWLCVVGQKIRLKSLIYVTVLLTVTIASVLTLTTSIAMLKGFKFGEIASAVFGILTLIGGLSLIAVGISAVFRILKVKITDILKTILIMGLIGLTALGTIPVFEELGKYNFKQLASVAAGIGLLFLSLTVVAAILGAIVTSGYGLAALVGGILSMVAMIGACLLLIPVIESFKDIKINDMVRIAFGLAAFFAILSLGTLVSVIGTPGIIAIIGIAGALRILAPALKDLLDIDSKRLVDVGKAIAKVLALLALVGILGAIGGPGLLIMMTAALMGAASFLLISEGLLLFSNAIVVILPLVPALATAIVTLAEAAGKAIVKFILTVVNGIPLVAVAIGNGIIVTCAVIEKTYPVVINTAANLVIAFLTGMKDKIPQIIRAWTDMIVAIFEALSIAMPEITAAGMDLIISLIEGIATQLEEKSERLSDAVGSFVTGLFKILIESIYKAIKGIGKTISDWIVNAIFGDEATEEEVQQATNSVGKALEGTGAKTEQTGKGVDALKSKFEGLFKSFKDGAKDTNNASKSVGGLSAQVSNLIDNLGLSDFTLTPVLDLDALDSQIPEMQSMLDESGLSLDSSTGSSSTGSSYSVKMSDMASSNLNGSGGSGSVYGNKTTNINYTQNNYSPKALDRAAIYRDTQNNIALIGRVNKQNA